MNRLKPIPPRASVMDFALKKTSRGNVEVHTPSERREPRLDTPRSLSPRKRQRTGINVQEHNPFDVDDAYVYLDYTTSQRGKVIPFFARHTQLQILEYRQLMITFVNGCLGGLNNCNNFSTGNQFQIIQDASDAMQIHLCIGVLTAMECLQLV